MSVQQPDVIDIVAHDPGTKEAMLVMVEGRNWDSAPEAVQQLETKLGGYAEFVLSGSLARQYPDYSEYSVRIELHHFHPIPSMVAAVLQKWAGRLSGAKTAIWSHRVHESPLGRVFAKVKATFGQQKSERVRWLPGAEGAEALLTRAQFTDEFIAAMQKSAPMYRIEAVQELEIKVVDREEKETKVFLDNAHAQYRVSPENKADVIRKYVASFFQTKTTPEGVNTSQIVPVLKDKGWIEEMNKGLKARGAEKPLEQLHEAYNEELIILYAEDNPTNIRYLISEDMRQLNLDLKQLRSLATENLERLLPPPDVSERDGVYRIRAGGDYDASLLLIKNLWELGKLPVIGEIVAAIPARDYLIVTGSQNVNGLRVVKAEAQKVAANAPYRLTAKLFVYRGGSFVIFEG